MNLQKQIQFQAPDLQTAYALHYKKRYPWRSRFLLFLGYGIVILGMIFFMPSLWANGGFLQDWFIFFFIGYGLLLVIVHYFFWLTMGKRMFKKLQDFHKPYTFIFDEQKLFVQGDGAQGFMEWGQYKEALVSENCILLYVNDILFHIVMRRFFTDQEWQKITDLVKQKF